MNKREKALRGLVEEIRLHCNPKSCKTFYVCQREALETAKGLGVDLVELKKKLKEEWLIV